MSGRCEVLFSTHVNHVSVSPTNGNGPSQGQSLSLSLSGPISVSRANAHVDYMGRK